MSERTGKATPITSGSTRARSRSTPTTRGGRRPARGLVLALCVCASAFAQAGKQPAPAARAQDLQTRALEAIGKGDAAGGEALLREQLALDPGNFVIYYNLACARSLQDDAPGGMDLLVRAVERGFVDLAQMRRDPQLARVRTDPRFERLAGNWAEVLRRQSDANLKATKAQFTQGAYAQSSDERLRVHVLSAMDETSTTQARADIARLYDWALGGVFADLTRADAAQADAWTVVVLPSPKDFVRWVVSSYGSAAAGSFSGIGGAYMHDEKRLVAQDLGATLRHEFFHVLHWRSTTRLGQDHPIWIQEGLCSLVEDYELAADRSPASLRPVPSWRTNISKRLLNAGKLLRIEQLAKVPRATFTGTNPLAHYGQARTVFLFLSDRGKLGEWYAHYTGHYAEDPTGVASIAAVFAKPIDQVEKDYRAWVRALPEVAEQLRPGEATLGVDVEPGTGDGPVIVGIPRLKKNEPAPARLAGLSVGDVITAVNGLPTRDLNELIRVLGAMKVGDEVEVEYRRRTQRGSAKIRLVPRQDD